MKNTFLFYIALIFIASSCLKEENPIEPFERNGSTEKVISTGNNGDYSNQIFYDLSANKEVKVVARTSWDLAFETSSDGFIVRLNTANKMQASKTGKIHFDSITSLTSVPLSYYWDRAEGYPDSTALRDWIAEGIPTSEVFVVDLGEKPNLNSRGHKKIQILSVNSSEYQLRYADVNGQNEHIITIPKNTDKNHTCFSFEGAGKLVDLEPNKDEWDVVFTQYLHTFNDSDPPVSYSVNGVLLNYTKVKAVKINDKEFEKITINDVSTYNLSSIWNTIGYDWKLFDLASSTYEIVPGVSYLIQDRKGFYYKLKFTDFYNGSGIKGYPKFEFVPL